MERSRLSFTGQRRENHFESKGACGFRSRGNNRQGRRLGGPKVESAHRRVSEAAPCLDCVLRDPVCAGVFVYARSAGTVRDVVFAISGRVFFHNFDFTVVPDRSVRFFRAGAGARARGGP